ncbi:EamA family transporter [Sneathiella sp. P13V-1]|uniref:DMT family transporter n=1 Tax=Sneathiella sp. P13V-1 TaxID=2697366 RepID=UPI00187B1364|nr:EamA family transporter [Sneathiella sp. P13V-1]MBE7638223.1 EamA family transporter [Sneathiella sp. P13V-1]
MRLALSAAAVTGIQVGFALVVSEAVVGEVGAGRLGFLRYLIALTFLLPFALRAKSPPIARKDILPVALIGVGQFGALIALLNLAVLYSNSVRVSLVFATLPLMTIGLTWLLFRTKLRKTEFGAICLTVIGVAILLGGDAAFGGLGFSEIGGLFSAALATFTGALCSILFGPYLKRYGVMRVSVIAMAASLVPLGIMDLFETGGAPMLQWTSQTIWFVFIIGLSSGAGFMLWLYGLTHAPAGMVTAFLSLSPATAFLLSMVFLEVEPTWTQYAALALIICGLLLLARGPTTGTD